VYSQSYLLGIGSGTFQAKEKHYEEVTWSEETVITLQKLFILLGIVRQQKLLEIKRWNLFMLRWAQSEMLFKVLFNADHLHAMQVVKIKPRKL